MGPGFSELLGLLGPEGAGVDEPGVRRLYRSEIRPAGYVCPRSHDDGNGAGRRAGGPGDAEDVMSYFSAICRIRQMRHVACLLVIAAAWRLALLPAQPPVLPARLFTAASAVSPALADVRTL